MKNEQAAGQWKHYVGSPAHRNLTQCSPLPEDTGRSSAMLPFGGAKRMTAVSWLDWKLGARML